MQAVKPKLPSMVELNDRTFWEGVQNEKFLLQRCSDCGRLQFPPGPVCRNCFGSHLFWEQACGRGTIYSFTAIHVPASPFFKQQIETSGRPIIQAFIDLEEQVRIVSEIVDCDPGELRLGARVSLMFQKIEGTDFKLPKFRVSG